MEIAYTHMAVQDIMYWRKSGNKKVQEKITAIIREIAETPFTGFGQPEALRYELSGLWSRRINKEHRIIYEVQEDQIIVHSLKGHY